MVEQMNLMNNIIASIQSLDKGLEKLLERRSALESEVQALKSQNEELKQRIKIIHSEMEIYIKELKEIREYYVSSNNNAK